MATEKVGVYRKYHGPVPKDKSDKRLPKSEWPRKRAFRWAVRWFGCDGKRYSRSFKTRKEAERFSDRKQLEIRKGKADPPKTISLRSFLSEHEKIMRGQVAPTTLYDQMRALKMFMSHIGKDVSLMDISPRHAESFVAARLTSRVKIGTVNKDIRTLRRVLSLAAEPRGYLPVGQNPFAKIRERKVSLKPVNYVSVQELQTVLSLVQRTWWQTLMILAYCSGGRRNELLNLTWADIDFEQLNICFSSKEASEELLAWEPKDHEIRVIPIPEKAVQLLADMQNEAEEGSPYAFIRKGRLAHILSRREKGTWNAKRDLINNLMRDLEVMCCRAGVKRFTFHDLRRSCITNWAQALPIHVVQQLAGHSDIKTTQRYYLAVRESDMERARQLQSEILGADLTDPKLTHSGQKQCSQRKCLQDGSL